MPAKKNAASRSRDDERVGVWLFGALGGLATTVVVGAHAIARGLAEPLGLTTATPLFEGVPLAPLDRLVFGGHEVRRGSPLGSAREIRSRTGTIPYEVLEALEGDLRAVGRDVRPGTLANCGATIRRLAEQDLVPDEPLADTVARLRGDVQRFMRKHRLSRCVCVNLTSTEPALRPTRAHRGPDALRQALDRDARKSVRPSLLYAWVAAELGLPFVHFTPSDSTLVPAVRERFEGNGAPYMGADGKTGETLVKSSLAPMFKYRNLRVLTWQGYNMLGDRDGLVLAQEENKRAKVRSKDALLGAILGYPLHSHVAIDYVPSLDDLKTAWDFVHFEGFLGHRMSLQFTWQGCDAILAAPLVLDLVRLADLARRRGESGPMRHLACFFKRPVGIEEHDLHRQWHMLLGYAERCRGTADPSGS